MYLHQVVQVFQYIQINICVAILEVCSQITYEHSPSFKRGTLDHISRAESQHRLYSTQQT